ncbi:hypothetical protein [Lihuaxuella thermophila]|uniref:Uncharacterized protein n=1 Tax=Lihuaxuella thermophila TaxID=1173111 RepID=A0A1H8H8U3_9BACL|nr:hypothetical protein [Lihuaxuella thermophila]SEN51958.1 hypothetical protein SAMN05444955_11368 [Lihuaxuella thermophila]
MLTMRIEGPRKEVSAFIRDIKNNPQHQVIAQSMPYMEDVLENNDVVSYCQFRYTPLSEVGKAFSITLHTTSGENPEIRLDYGKVIRIGNIVQVVGKVATRLPQIPPDNPLLDEL